MGTKHTPGPWFAKNTHHIYGADLRLVACAARLYPETSDAALIAAAPEMLEALQACVELMSQRCVGLDEQILANQIIAKATGGDK